MEDRLTDARRLVLRRDLAEVGRAAEWMESIAARSGWPEALIFRLRLCLEEAISNVIRHGIVDIAASEVFLSLQELDRSVTACVEDEGQAFDPTQYPSPERAASIEQAKIGGFGIQLMHRFATEMKYQRVGSRNRLVLVFDRT